MTWYYWHSHFEVTWETYWRPVSLCTTISTCNICICRRFSNVYPYFKLDYYYYYSTKKILFYENLHLLLLLSRKRLSPLEYHTNPGLNFSSHQSTLIFSFRQITLAVMGHHDFWNWRDNFRGFSCVAMSLGGLDIWARDVGGQGVFDGGCSNQDCLAGSEVVWIFQSFQSLDWNFFLFLSFLNYCWLFSSGNESKEGMDLKGVILEALQVRAEGTRFGGIQFAQRRRYFITQTCLAAQPNQMFGVVCPNCNVQAGFTFLHMFWENWTFSWLFNGMWKFYLSVSFAQETSCNFIGDLSCL